MYAGFIMLFWPMIISAWAPSLVLSNTPQIFSFEDDLNSVSSTSGTPTVVDSPSGSKRKVVECQNGEYIRWDLARPSKTIDLTFKIYWTKFPTIVNETLSVGEIWGLNDEIWQLIFGTTILCNRYGNREWNIGTGIPIAYYNPVSSDVVYALETNRWYTIRMTADLITGTYRLYLDAIELASITDILIPDDVYIDFFRLGAGAQGTTAFVTYYDDVAASFLDPSPPPGQWSVRITSSPEGLTNPYGTMNLNHGESLTANAIDTTGYVFNKWILDGIDYSKNSTVILPTQQIGMQHTLHAMFRGTEAEPENWLPLQMIALAMIGSGGYLLWSQNKRISTKGVKE